MEIVWLNTPKDDARIEVRSDCFVSHKEFFDVLNRTYRRDHVFFCIRRLSFGDVWDWNCEIDFLLEYPKPPEEGYWSEIVEVKLSVLKAIKSRKDDFLLGYICDGKEVKIKLRKR